MALGNNKSQETIVIKVEGAKASARAIDGVADSQKKVESATRRADRATKEGGRGLATMRDALLAAGGAAVTLQAAFAALGGAIRGSIGKGASLAISFEKEFAAIQTLSESVGDNLKSGLLDLAATVPQTAGDITKSAYQAISAGIDPTETVAFLQRASEVAVGANVSMTDAVNLLSSAVNAFGAQGVTAESAADSFFSAVRDGKTTITELNQTFGNVAALGQMGVKLGEVNSAVAALTKLGMPTAEAVTRINAAVKVIAKPTGQALKNFRALNVEFGIGRLQSVGLAGVLRDLQDATGGSAEILGTFSRRMEANQALLGLLGQNYNEFSTILENNAESAGESERAFKIMMATTQGSIDLLKALSEDVLRRLGERVMPTISDAVQRLTAYLQENGDELIETMAGAFESLVGLGEWLLSNGRTIATIIGSIFATKAVFTFGKALAGVTSKIGSMASSAAGLGGVMRAALTSPTVIGALVGAGIMLGSAVMDAFNEEVRENLERAEQQVLEWERRLDKRAKDRGFASNEAMKKRRAEIDRGVRLGFEAAPGGGALPADITGHVTKDLRTPAEEIAFRERELILDEKMEQSAARALAIKETQEAVEADIEKRKASALELDRQAYELSVRASDFVPSRERELQQAGATAEDANAQAIREEKERGLFRERMTAEDRHRRDALVAEAFEIRKGAVALEAAAGVAEFESTRGGAPAAAPRKRIATKDDSGKRAAEDYARRVTAAQSEGEIAEIEDQGDRRLAALRATHAAEIEAFLKKGVETTALESAFSEIQASAAAKLAETRESQAIEAVNQAGDAARARYDAEREVEVMRLESLGADAAAELDRQRMQQDAELLQFRGSLEAKARLSSVHARQRRNLAESVARAEREGIVESVGASIGALGELASALGASEKMAGAFEAAQIIAGGVLHAFKGGNEVADAAAAFAAQAYSKAALHGLAATLHFAQAATAGVTAAQAFSGGGGGGGSVGASSPSRAPSGRRVDEGVARDREAAPLSITVNLADVPALFSSRGLEQLGAGVARTVSRELTRQGGRA